VLTSLPNRRAFSDRLPEGMMRARRADQLLALFFMDIDGFKGSTTAMATKRAMSCSSSSRAACSVRCAMSIPWRAWPVTSSW
jgi:predicted signal transduction protein with EAL and GGDEF domain